MGWSLGAREKRIYIYISFIYVCVCVHCFYGCEFMSRENFLYTDQQCTTNKKWTSSWILTNIVKKCTTSNLFIFRKFVLTTTWFLGYLWHIFFSREKKTKIFVKKIKEPIQNYRNINTSVVQDPRVSSPHFQLKGSQQKWPAKVCLRLWKATSWQGWRHWMN